MKYDGFGISALPDTSSRPLYVAALCLHAVVFYVFRVLGGSYQLSDGFLEEQMIFGWLLVIDPCLSRLKQREFI